jgi:hypothetical protein
MGKREAGRGKKKMVREEERVQDGLLNTTLTLLPASVD